MGHSKSINSSKGEVSTQPYLRKQEKAQINNLTLYLKEMEKEEVTKSKVSRRKQTIKIRAEIHKLEMKKINSLPLNRSGPSFLSQP